MHSIVQGILKKLKVLKLMIALVINSEHMKSTNNIRDKSEKRFEDYLVKFRLEYEKNFDVGKGNVDFIVKKDDLIICCDVKAILVTTDKLTSRDVAIRRIRKDIQNLRNKFGSIAPEYPCVLISMNYSPDVITGFTIVQAMYGEADISYNRETFQLIRPLHHSPKGKAKMTTSHNTGITGILAFEGWSGNHLFHNEFAKHPIPNSFFPDCEDVFVKRESLRDDLGELGSIII